MTDEIKMCVFQDGKWYGIVPGQQYYEPSAWIPIDPQPCCANCEDKDRCSVNALIREEPHAIRNDKFCCNHWKPKVKE